MKADGLSKRLAQMPGLPFVTLMGLVLAALFVSILSTYDAEARWLRFGSVLLAVGIAMWLPAWQAVAVALGVSLVSGLLRGGTGDTGLLRWETLVEAPGLAAGALLTVWLREQIAFLLSQSRLTTNGVRDGNVALRAVPVAPHKNAIKDEMQADLSPQEQPSNNDGTESPHGMPAAPSLLPFHRDESLASYTTYLACLQLELTKTAQIINEVRSCPGSDVDLGFESTPDEPFPAAVMQHRRSARLAL